MIVMAGGKSSRMGEDKTKLPFGTSPSLLQYQHDRLEEIFERVYVSAKAGSTYNFDALVIEDATEFEHTAPMTGILSAFKRLKAEDALFILSVDTPFVTQNVFDAFASIDKDTYDAVIVRTSSGIHPLCGVYSRKMEAPMFNSYVEGNYTLKNLLENANVYYLDIEEELLLTNINTPEHYKEALKLL